MGGRTKGVVSHPPDSIAVGGDIERSDDEALLSIGLGKKR